MSSDVISEWFSCPFCGDDGELVSARMHTLDSVEFYCESREHRLSNKWFNKFRAKTKERFVPRRNRERSWLERFGFGQLDTRFNKRLESCLSCPDCGSDNAFGALEQLEIDAKDYKTVRYGITTVWCGDCNNHNRSWISRDGYTISKDDIDKKSEYPPAYI